MAKVSKQFILAFHALIPSVALAFAQMLSRSSPQILSQMIFDELLVFLMVPAVPFHHLSIAIINSPRSKFQTTMSDVSMADHSQGIFSGDYLRRGLTLTRGSFQKIGMYVLMMTSLTLRLDSLQLCTNRFWELRSYHLSAQITLLAYLRLFAVMTAVRVCVCGDENVGKSSLISSLVKNNFVSTPIQAVLPQITLPPSLGTPENFTTTIVDTSALPQERANLNKEIRKSNVILLVYSDHYSYERVALFWMPHFRSLGVNVPVVLCASKSDLSANVETDNVVEDEMLPVMAEFKEIDTCIRTSAKELHNINEVFFLCQKAVTDPIAPLFDSKEFHLKPACISALRRVFYLCDRDQDGYLSNKEMHNFQKKCFGSSLSDDDLDSIKEAIQKFSPESVNEKGIDQNGFITLNKIYVERGRHETVWIILRTFHYTDSLSLRDSFLHPKFEVPPYTSAELSPAGYRFFVDLFLLFDKDNDGGLNSSELSSLFAPTPGLPPSWLDSAFPSSTVRNEAGNITLQGWLAQWSMTTFFSPATTLAYLAYLGFTPADARASTTAALHLTKARKNRKKPVRVERNVFLAYIIGSPGAGKSSLLDAFLSRPYSQTYHPTIKARTAVNSVELQGGKQCTLILEELGELEPAILENQTKLQACDVLVYTYDSSDPDSFAHITSLRTQHPHLDGLPTLYVALKADNDKTTQRAEVQPEEYTAELGMNKPLHVSVTWASISELFVQIAEAGMWPATAFPKNEDEGKGALDRMGLYIALGATVCTAAVFLAIWKRLAKD